MKMINRLMMVAVLAFASVAVALATTQDAAATQDKPAEAKRDKVPGDPYPLETCIVAGVKLGENGEPVIFEHEGRELRACCQACVAKFEADPKTYLKAADAEIIKRQLESYPMEMCLVMTDEPVESDLGRPSNIVHNNRLVRLCCRMCVRRFNRNPDQYLTALNDHILKTQAATYPLETCVVGGHELGDDAVDLVIANQLVRLCCKDCVKSLRADPLTYMARIDAARKAESSATQSDG